MGIACENALFIFCVIGVFQLASVQVGGAVPAPTLRQKREACPAVRECLAPVPMIEEFAEKDNVKGLFALSYGVLLDQVCSKKDELRVCLDSADCPDVFTSHVGKVTLKTLDYICGDGRERLLSESKCFARDSFEQQLKFCANSFELRVEIQTVKIQPRRQTNAAYCGLIDKYLKCVKEETKNTCSSIAANFMRDLSVQTLTPLAEMLGCTLQ